VHDGRVVEWKGCHLTSRSSAAWVLGSRDSRIDVSPPAKTAGGTPVIGCGSAPQRTPIHRGGGRRARPRQRLPPIYRPSPCRVPFLSSAFRPSSSSPSRTAPASSPNTTPTHIRPPATTMTTPARLPTKRPRTRRHLRRACLVCAADSRHLGPHLTQGTEKTAKQTSDIILYDGKIVVFKMESDVMLYVVGSAEENEVLLYRQATTRDWPRVR